jgi:glucosamine-phosphate N-acetyltransferase
MIVRQLTREDLFAGFVEALGSLAEVGINSPARLLELYDLRQRQGVLTFVCVEHDRVLGTASLVVEQKFIHGGGKVGHVEDVAVHPGHQSRGVGRRLVGHAVEQASRHGCYKVILNCSDRLVGFYGLAGFRPRTNGMRLDLTPHAAQTATGPTPARCEAPAPDLAYPVRGLTG